jgi:hypothetical protein
MRRDVRHGGPSSKPITALTGQSGTLNPGLQKTQKCEQPPEKSGFSWQCRKLLLIALTKKEILLKFRL